MMKKVLLTGATGFIGRHSIPFLLAEGYEIHAIARNNQSFPPTVHVHQVDLCDDHQIIKLLNVIKPSHLLHFAWYTIPGKYWTSEANLDWVRSSIKLFQEFVANGGKRIVVSGTCAEYEWGGSHPCEEYSTPLKPHSLYGACKSSLYQLLEAYAKQSNISFAWGRIFFLYGPFEYKERLVSSVILKLLRHEIAACSHGNQIRDFMHVEDVASGFVSLLNSDMQGAVNIASGQNVTLKQVIHAIAEKVNSVGKVQHGSILTPNDPPVITANISRLANELKWTPKYSLDEGLNQTIAWWKKTTV